MRMKEKNCGAKIEQGLLIDGVEHLSIEGLNPFNKTIELKIAVL
jgi:hypothetical protein